MSTGILFNHSAFETFDPLIYNNGVMSKSVTDTGTFITKGTVSFDESYITLQNTYGNVSDVAVGLQVNIPSGQYTRLTATFVRTYGANMYLSLYVANSVVNPRNGSKIVNSRGDYNQGTTTLNVDISSVNGTVWLCVGIDTNGGSWGTTRTFHITDIHLS